MNVPINKFPFITCYGKMFNRIYNENNICKYEDALLKEDPWFFGNVYYEGGFSPNILNFEIWNNEPDVSAGYTQLIYNDAIDCKIYIECENEDIIFKIKNMQNKNFDTIINKCYDNLYSTRTLKKGILSGRGDCMKFQLCVDILNSIEQDKILFNIIFEYRDQFNTIIDKENNESCVKLIFPCYINIKNNYDNLIINNILNINNVTNEITGINNGTSYSLSAYKNGILKDTNIFNTNKYYLFLNDGNYNLNLKSNNTIRKFENINIKGIKENYTQIKDIDLIKFIHDDIIEYSNDITEVFGRICDKYNNPLKCQIILSQEDNVIVNYFTNDNGYFRFIVMDGIYDVRILSENKNVKIIKQFNFNKDNGFFTEINKLYPSYEYIFNQMECD